MRIIDTKEMTGYVESDIPVVNVLPTEIYAKGHIPGSINIPTSRVDFAREVEEAIGGKDRPAVIYCANSHCLSSQNAAAMLEQAGFTDVIRYQGGLAAWQDAHRQVAVS